MDGKDLGDKVDKVDKGEIYSITPLSPISPKSLTGIVLAGGLSSRMGEDKALLTIRGVPLLRVVSDVAIALCESVYIITPWTERYQHVVSPMCQFIKEIPLLGSREDLGDLGEKMHTRPRAPTNGPLVGFAQGLAHVQTDWVLLLACDLPKLQIDVLQTEVAKLDNVEAEAIALLAKNSKGWEPLCGFYRRSCLPALKQYINSGGRSFQQWLAQHPVQVLPLSDGQMLFNCNTPADYAALNDI